MAGDSMNTGKKRRGPGRPFEPGKSGNYAGLSKKTIETRRTVAQALDAAFRGNGDTDALVMAIVEGVSERDSTCLKLACEYRWGKPTQPIDLNGVLLAMTREQAIEELKKRGYQIALPEPEEEQ